MLKFLTFIVTIVFISGSCLQRSKAVGKVTFILGASEKLQRRGNRAALELDDKIYPGEGFTTGKNSFVDVKLKSAQIRLLENSQLVSGEFISVNPYYLERSITKIYLKRGKCQIFTNSNRKQMPTSFETRIVRIFSNKARFILEHTPTYTKIHVLKGTVLAYRILPELENINEKIYQFSKAIRKIRSYNNKGVRLKKGQQLIITVSKTMVQNQRLMAVNDTARQIVDYRRDYSNYDLQLELNWQLKKTKVIVDTTRFLAFYRDIHKVKIAFKKKEKKALLNFTKTPNLTRESARVHQLVYRSSK